MLNRSSEKSEWASMLEWLGGRGADSITIRLWKMCGFDNVVGHGK
jgi:hypothetical protein